MGIADDLARGLRCRTVWFLPRTDRIEQRASRVEGVVTTGQINPVPFPSDARVERR